MKRFLKLLLLTISILMVSIPVFANEYDTMLISENYDTTIANNSILVQLNGEVIDFKDENGKVVEPQIINDRTMVPMRKIFEVLGATISWDAETRSVTGVKDDVTVKLQIDNLEASKTVNGVEEKITLDSAPTIVNDRTLVPVRFIAESLDKKVGWDAYNRAVIIIDTSFAEETLKTNASNFYEYITADYEKINTYEMDLDLAGKVKYIDNEIASNNTTLNIAGDMKLNLGEKAIAMDLGLNFTGKGILIEQLKEQKLDKLNAKLILNIEENLMYLKIDEIEEFAGKWIKTDLGEEGKELKNIFEMAKNQESVGVDAIFDMLLPEDSLNVSSYKELNQTVLVVAALMGNDNFKVSGRTDKTYTYSLDLTEIIEMIMKLSGEEDVALGDDFKFEMGFEVKVKDKVAKESKCNLLIKVNEAEESVEVDVTANAELTSYNKPVTIDVPNAAEVMEL